MTVTQQGDGKSHEPAVIGSRHFRLSKLGLANLFQRGTLVSVSSDFHDPHIVAIFKPQAVSRCPLVPSLAVSLVDLADLGRPPSVCSHGLECGYQNSWWEGLAAIIQNSDSQGRLWKPEMAL
jgi:hypothetical protein